LDNGGASKRASGNLSVHPVARVGSYCETFKARN